MFIANLKTFGVFKQNVYFALFRKVRPLNNAHRSKNATYSYAQIVCRPRRKISHL